MSQRFSPPERGRGEGGRSEGRERGRRQRFSSRSPVDTEPNKQTRISARTSNVLEVDDPPDEKFSIVIPEAHLVTQFGRTLELAAAEVRQTQQQTSVRVNDELSSDLGFLNAIAVSNNSSWNIYRDDVSISEVFDAFLEGLEKDVTDLSAKIARNCVSSSETLCRPIDLKNKVTEDLSPICCLEEAGLWEVAVRVRSGKGSDGKVADQISETNELLLPSGSSEWAPLRLMEAFVTNLANSERDLYRLLTALDGLQVSRNGVSGTFVSQKTLAHKKEIKRSRISREWRSMMKSPLLALMKTAYARMDLKRFLMRKACEEFGISSSPKDCDESTVGKLVTQLILNELSVLFPSKVRSIQFKNLLSRETEKSDNDAGGNLSDIRDKVNCAFWMIEDLGKPSSTLR